MQLLVNFFNKKLWIYKKKLAGHWTKVLIMDEINKPQKRKSKCPPIYYCRKNTAVYYLNNLYNIMLHMTILIICC